MSDFTLQVGAVTDTVTVSADSETVNTMSAELGAVVDNTRVTEMPLNGRTFFSLATLVPGVAPPTQGSSLGYRGGFNVSGSCEGCNNFSLNGIENNDNTTMAPMLRPSIHAIQEFTILTGVYPAQYGYGSGGQVIVTTKSGTKSLSRNRLRLSAQFCRSDCTQRLSSGRCPLVQTKPVRSYVGRAH